MKNIENYRRIWIKGYYRSLKLKGINNKPIRKWCKGYWRKIKLKELKK